MTKTTLVIIFTCFTCGIIGVAQNNGPQTRLPTTKSFATPVFPEGVPSEEIVGTVLVRARIDVAGAVSILDSFGPNVPCSRLDDARITAIRAAVVNAVEKTDFEPALNAGEKVDAELILLYSFDAPSEKQWQMFDPIEYDPKRLPQDTTLKKTSGNLVKGKAIKLPKPKVSFKEALFRKLDEGLVSVYVLINTNGHVISAGALNGDIKLRDRSIRAACKAVFSPTTLDGMPVKVSGSIVYDFKK